MNTGFKRLADLILSLNFVVKEFGKGSRHVSGNTWAISGYD